MADHLCVLVHGLWGNPVHLNHVRDTLRKQQPKDRVEILVAQSNSDSFTYDGIGVGAERITREIEQKLEEAEQDGASIRKISIVGYSLGGLVARYSIGLLYKNGIFDRVQPVNFTTFATPHLGVRSPSPGYMTNFFNTMGSRTLSASGQQMFLTDSFQDTGRPLLSIMADPSGIFVKGLSLFKNKSIYANIINDRSVPYFTADISKTDPYVDLDKVDLHYLDDKDNLEHPCLLDPVEPVTLSANKSPPTFAQNLTAFGQNLPFYAAFTLFVPIGITGFLVNAGYQTYASAKRIALHESSKADDTLGRYHIPPLIQEAQAAQTRLQTQIAASRSEEYLPTPPPEPASSSSSSVLGGSSKAAHDSQQAETSNGTFPTLALTKEQLEMVDNLNSLGMKRFPVYIKQVRHTHAAIVVRTSRTDCEEARVVSRHWARNFEV